MFINLCSQQRLLFVFSRHQALLQGLGGRAIRRAVTATNDLEQGISMMGRFRSMYVKFIS